MSRWPFWAATHKGVLPFLSAWSLPAPTSARNCTTSRWPLRAAGNRGVCPCANSGSSVFAPASSSSSICWTRPCSAAWNKGVLPSVFDSSGFRGCCSNCSRATESFSLDAEIIFSVSTWSGGQNSNTTNWIFTGTGSRTSSSWISCKPFSLNNLCLNLEMPTLVAKAFFTALAEECLAAFIFSRTMRVSPHVVGNTPKHGCKILWVICMYTKNDKQNIMMDRISGDNVTRCHKGPVKIVCTPKLLNNNWRLYIQYSMVPPVCFQFGQSSTAAYVACASNNVGYIENFWMPNMQCLDVLWYPTISHYPNIRGPPWSDFVSTGVFGFEI